MPARRPPLLQEQSLAGSSQPTWQVGDTGHHLTAATQHATNATPFESSSCCVLPVYMVSDESASEAVDAIFNKQISASSEDSLSSRGLGANHKVNTEETTDSGEGRELAAMVGKTERCSSAHPPCLASSASEGSAEQSAELEASTSNHWEDGRSPCDLDEPSPTAGQAWPHDDSSDAPLQVPGRSCAHNCCEQTSEAFGERSTQKPPRSLALTSSRLMLHQRLLARAVCQKPTRVGRVEFTDF